MNRHYIRAHVNNNFYRTAVAISIWVFNPIPLCEAVTTPRTYVGAHFVLVDNKLDKIVWNKSIK